MTSSKSLLFWSAIVISLLFFHTRGFISHDEGWVLNAASRILDGEVPYRDFYFLYTPGSIFSVALFFKFLGESILTARMLALLFSIASVSLLYKILERLTSNKSLVTGSIFLFLLWGPFQINFVWMVMLSISSGLAVIYFILKSNENSNYACLAGISAALTLLFKQNFGVAIILVSVIAFIFNSKLQTKTQILNFIFGYIFVAGSFVIYLLANDSFFVFINQMRLLLQKTLIEGMLVTPFIYPAEFYKQVLKLIFYLSPAAISVYSIFLAFKHNKKFIFVSIFPLFYYIFSIRPTTDLIHLAPLISISGISLALMYFLWNNKLHKKIISFAYIILIALGLYIVIFRGYYRWDAPILSHNYFYKHPRVNIFVDAKNKEVLDKIKPELEKSKSGYIFVYHFAPMFYFISDKKNPTFYDDLQPKLLTETEQRKIISNIQGKRVDTILSNSDIKVESTILAKFILTNYYPYKTIHDYTIWKHKAI